MKLTSLSILTAAAFFAVASAYPQPSYNRYNLNLDARKYDENGYNARDLEYDDMKTRSYDDQPEIDSREVAVELHPRQGAQVIKLAEKVLKEAIEHGIKAIKHLIEGIKQDKKVYALFMNDSHTDRW